MTRALPALRIDEGTRLALINFHLMLLFLSAASRETRKTPGASGRPREILHDHRPHAAPATGAASPPKTQIRRRKGMFRAGSFSFRYPLLRRPTLRLKALPGRII